MWGLGCIQFNGFDIYAEDGIDVGEFTSYEVYIDGVLLNTVVTDYTVNYDGTNVSTYFTDLVNYVNNNTNFTMSVVTDVLGVDGGKVLWQLDYDGPGSEQLRIVKLSDVVDTYEFDIDNSGTMTGSITDDLGQPFATPAIIQPCA